MNLRRIQESRTERGLSSPQQSWNVLQLRETPGCPFLTRCCGLESPMSRGFAPHHPGGMADNSPTFQRWEPTVNGVQVPKGRLTVHAVSRPFGNYCAWVPDPNVET